MQTLLTLICSLNDVSRKAEPTSQACFVKFQMCNIAAPCKCRRNLGCRLTGNIFIVTPGKPSHGDCHLWVHLITTVHKCIPTPRPGPLDQRAKEMATILQGTYNKGVSQPLDIVSLEWMCFSRWPCYFEMFYVSKIYCFFLGNKSANY